MKVCSGGSKNNTRIGFIHGFLPYPPTAGGSVHVYQVTHGLIKRGYSIYSFVGDTNPLFKKYRRGKRGAWKFAKDIDLLYIRMTGYSYYNKFNLLKFTRLFSLPLIWELNAPIEEIKVGSPNLQDAAERVIKKAKKQYKFFAKFVDAAICVSEEMKSYSYNFLGIKNSFVVPNGSDPVMFNPKKRNEALYDFLGYRDSTIKVLWAGSAKFSWQGIDIILKVAKEFLNINRKVKFILITDRKYLKAPLYENVTVIDKVDYFSMPEYIASSDICLCLYNEYSWSPIGFYGSPLKLFDYMASAKPVIATAAGQIKRVIKDGKNGFLTDNSLEDIIKKLLLLIHNKEKSAQMGRLAREAIIKYYNWDRVIQQTIDIFNNVKPVKLSR